jgi:sporulation protein YlmC with PRC-barrel domain
MRLVRDVLDKKILDRDNRETGCVDGIVIEFPQGRQPRMVRLEIGGEILAARVARWLVSPVRWLAANWGPKRQGNVSIDWRHISRMGRTLHIDLSADDTEALAWEHWLSEHIVSRIPGSRA